MALGLRPLAVLPEDPGLDTLTQTYTNAHKIKINNTLKTTIKKKFKVIFGDVASLRPVCRTWNPHLPCLTVDHHSEGTAAERMYPPSWALGKKNIGILLWIMGSTEIWGMSMEYCRKLWELRVRKAWCATWELKFQWQLPWEEVSLDEGEVNRLGQNLKHMLCLQAGTQPMDWVHMLSKQANNKWLKF